MPETDEVIEDLKKLANDIERADKLINESSHGENLSLIRWFVQERPEDIPKILRTIREPEFRSRVMTFCDRKKSSPSSPLEALEPTHVPAVLMCLRAKDRLDYIRQEDSGATEYGKSSNAEFKYINFVIYCDLYLEHLQKSSYAHPTDSPKLTKDKIEAIEKARAILTDKPESDDAIREFYDHLANNAGTLTQHRDTQFTSFLKAIGLECLVNLAYNSFFAKTDGKVLLEKIEAIKQQNNQPKPS
ncbi:MAG: hypothetical protein P1U39_01560 [Legionellaceae bacterium]|nr:hypothetical protein [Legionellaceae bacterium]